MLGLNVFAVTTVPVDPAADLGTILPDHLEYQQALEAQGILLLAGPIFGKDAQKPSGGFIILRARDFDHAAEIAAADPFHISGLRTFVIHRWRLNEGGFSLTVHLSKGAAEFT